MTACRDAFCPRAEREIACAQKIIDNKDAEIERLTADNAKVKEQWKKVADEIKRLENRGEWALKSAEMEALNAQNAERTNMSKLFPGVGIEEVEELPVYKEYPKDPCELCWHRAWHLVPEGYQCAYCRVKNAYLLLRAANAKALEALADAQVWRGQAETKMERLTDAVNRHVSLNATALEALKAARDHRHAYSTHRLIHAAIKLLEEEAEHDSK
ncbi:MAG TPA: hypothetical protein VM182_10300 [Terriglobia bacterium]|nr:hypothetical protein [Terriglobia bacterium]